jgi:hypothetical protein
MVEMGLVGVSTAAAIYLYFRLRDEQVQTKSWKDAHTFAQQEVSRWKKEAQRWEAVADHSGGGLMETELKLPNIEDLLQART